jgi:hypothetical protein
VYNRRPFGMNGAAAIAASVQILKRVSWSIAIVAAVLPCVARAQQAGSTDIQRLHFLSGTWRCTVHGGPSNGLVQDARYTFSPDGRWMTETSHDAGSDKNWETQMWGYDAAAKKLIAVQFVRDGVFSKTVDGWTGDRFVSHRNDNGAEVSLERAGSDAATWTIASADRSFVVTQTCVRTAR